MSLWLHEISEADHRILNALTDDKLMLIGELSRVGPGDRVLDLACGKGELLCRWPRSSAPAARGVDISEVFLPAAGERAAELEVADRVEFVLGDAGAYRPDRPSDVVSCIGATWIGNGLAGTIALMRESLAAGGQLLVGEPYWIDPPPVAAYAALDFKPDDYTSLAGTLDRFVDSGVERVEMVLADGDGWDRYAAGSGGRWTAGCAPTRRIHAGRGYGSSSTGRGARTSSSAAGTWGWGVFLLRVAPVGETLQALA